MYESFYKLHPTPFRLTPDPHFFYESDTHKRGLAYLRFAFYQREGFVVITGAPGTGKTELMLNLINEMPRDKVSLAKIVTSNLDADDLIDLVAASFLIDPDHVSKGSLIKRLENYFVSQARMGKHVLLLIDEAHNLSVKSLIELSMLSNFQIDEKPLLQCFLLGQEPLEDKLGLSELVHLKQRVIASTHLENLTAQETRDYILHRLMRSGWNNNPIIRDTAFALIHFYTKGVPRKINSMCNRILLQAFLENRNDIGADLVHHVIEELQEEITEDHINLDVELASMKETLNLDAVDNIDNTDQYDEPPIPSEQVPQENYKPSNVINIPEFIKKKESRPPEHETQNLEPTTASSTHQQVAPSVNHESEFETATETLAVESKANGADTKIAAKNKSYHLKHEAQVATSVVNRVDEHHHPLNRPSGLIDKELQFLAGLNESSNNPQKNILQQNKVLDSRTEQAFEKAPDRKVIIDESVYEDYGMGATDLEEDFPDTGTDSSNLKHYLQSITAVAIVLTAIGVSIYRWYDGGAEIIDQTAEVKSQTIATENTATENANTDADNRDKLLAQQKFPVTAIPEMPVPAPVFPSTSGIQSGLTAQTETEPENSETEVQLAVIDSSSSDNQPPAQIAAIPSIAEGNAGANKLDKEGSETALTVTGADQANMNSKAASESKPSTNRKNSEAVKVTQSENQKSLAKTEQSVIKVEDPPLIGSPVAGLTNDSHSEQQTVVRRASSNTSRSKVATTAQGARKNTHVIAKTKPIPFISNNDLRTLLVNLSTAYETGNLQKLVSTFASDIYSSDGSNREQLTNDYQRLFDVTDTRRLAIHDMKWLEKDRQMLGNGDFRVLIREKGATNFTTYEGKIRFTVARESNNIVIKKLDYDYNN